MKPARWWMVCATLAVTLGAGCHRGPPSPPPAPALPTTAAAPPDGRVAVVVDGEGYHPATITARPGAPLTLVFTRTTDETCGQRVRFPGLNIERELPLQRPVEVAVATPASGAVNFTCGMGMFQGSVVAR